MGLMDEQESVRGRHEERAFLAEERVGQSCEGQRRPVCLKGRPGRELRKSGEKGRTLIGVSCPPAKKQALSLAGSTAGIQVRGVGSGLGSRSALGKEGSQVSPHSAEAGSSKSSAGRAEVPGPHTLCTSGFQHRLGGGPGLLSAGSFRRRKGGALECADLCLLQGPGAETHSFQHRSSAEARGGCGPMLGRTTQEHPLPLGWFPEGLWLPWSLRPPPQHPSLMRRGRPLRPGLAQVHSQGSAGSVLPGQGCAGTLEAGGPAAPFRKLHNWFWKPLQLHRSRAHMACVLREVAWWLEGVGAARKAAGQGLGL